MPITVDPVRVLVAGAGAFGREHIGRLAGRSDASLVGVAEVNAAALDARVTALSIVLPTLCG